MFQTCSGLARRMRVKAAGSALGSAEDRKSTRLNSSHANISYAVFCLNKSRGLAGPARPRRPLLAWAPGGPRVRPLLAVPALAGPVGALSVVLQPAVVGEAPGFLAPAA